MPILKTNSVLPELCNEIEVVSEVLLEHLVEVVWGNSIESGGLVLGKLFDGAKELFPREVDVNLPLHLP